MPDYPMVRVEWIDSMSHAGYWHPVADSEAKADEAIDAHCFTVGFLVCRTERHATIAQSAHNDQVSDLMTIPLVNVVSLTTLTPEAGRAPSRRQARQKGGAT